MLLTFNQREYVGASAASVLAQDYPNLEVVLSDHNSDDGTAEVLARVADAYAGPHDVRLTQSSSPGGILGHLRDAAAETRGELIVVAAGDDVSLPDRVARLAKVWRETSASIVHSGATAMDSAGRALAREGGINPYHNVGDYFPGLAISPVHGATAAYERTALLGVAPPPFAVFPEDLFLTLMIGLRGGTTAFIPEPLVRFRIHPGAYTARPAFAGSVPQQEQAFAERSAHTARIFRHVAAAYREMRAAGAPTGALDLDRLEADARFHETRAVWGQLSVAKRAAALLRTRRRGQARWMLPRLFGLPGLRLVRRLRDQALPARQRARPG